MAEKIEKGVIRKVILHGNFRKHNLEARIRDSPTQLKIVGKIVHQRFKPANCLQGIPTERQGRTKRKVDASLHQPCGKDTRNETCADAHRFQLRTYSRACNRAVQAGHHSNPRIRKYRYDPP